MNQYEEVVEIVNNIKSLWSEDCKINEGNLSNEIANIPLLHSKYLHLLSEIKLMHKKLTSSFLRLQKAKMKYYRGEMTKAELDKYGWVQYQGNKILKSEMNDVLKMDDDIIDHDEKINAATVAIQMLESILKEINSRNYSIRTMVDWTKMMNGLN